jgi:protein-S-isoprenylcysteine O-methyltransferase Ste14
MVRILALIYGLASFALLLDTIPYAIGFVGDFAVPGTINTGAMPLSEASFNNLRLLSLLAIRHSVTARKSFRRWWTRHAPASIERTTCALLASR